MRFYVGVLLFPTSSEADSKHIVRGCENPTQAIEVFMKSEDLYRAYAAYAYPVSRRKFGPNADDWYRNIRCSVRSKISMERGMPESENTLE